MSEIGLWHAVLGAQTTRLLAEGIPSEKDLENWIFEDPTLLSSSLVRVRRQVPLGGKFMDLFAIEEPGVWVVCELKKTPLYRDSLAQAIDYVARLDIFNRLRRFWRSRSCSLA
jgi:RecB family endonuclease NucS